MIQGGMTFPQGITTLQQGAKGGPSTWRIAFIQAGWP